MKILFFDMEFANGNIPGSVYSFGYVQTNERFELTEPQTDLLINPDCEWHWYVRKKILAYPIDTVKEASLFPAYYRRLKKLLCKADLAVGYASKNDTVALEKACERYGLKPLRFSCLDMEKMCKKLRDHPEAHGLSGCVRAYCGIEPENQHRSDGDAYATMLLLKAICESKGIPAKKIRKQFEDCFIPSISEAKPVKPAEKETDEKPSASGRSAKKKKNDAKKSGSKEQPVAKPAMPQAEANAAQPAKRKRRRRRHRGGKKPAQSMAGTAENARINVQS